MGVAKNLKEIKTCVSRAESRFQRTPGSVRLLAVSKTHPAALIREAYDAGHKQFGESYIQEAIEKQAELHDCDIEWHFIGTIQSNKTKLIAEHFDWVQSVNRLKIAKRLNDQRPLDRLPLNICIEVNVSREATKSGVEPDALHSLMIEVSAFKHLRLRGLMVIPEHTDTFEAQKNIFEHVAMLQKQLIDAGFELDTLSMGMTDDFEAAIAAGSTMIRIGTGIFGVRNA